MGVGVVFQHEHVDKINYYITNAVNIFGDDWRMFGSNCSPDSLFHSYDAIVYLVKQVLVIYPLEDQKKYCIKMLKKFTVYK